MLTTKPVVQEKSHPKIMEWLKKNLDEQFFKTWCL
ncbi:hypothetical protein BH11BAC3_BH11BAC3_04850 [soil metagenome]